MRSAKPQIGKGPVGDLFDDSITDEEMDRALADAHDEIDALLQQAYDAKQRGESAPLEPLQVLLAEERIRFNASRS